MITKYYQCEFLSDIVLPASSNTQGNIRLSDFVAGSNFLGMVAAGDGYASFGEDSFEVFHSGAVCFGDAHLLVDGKESFKIPLAYHNLKVGEGYYNRLHLSEAEENDLREAQKQLKQIRTGFMNEALYYQTPAYNYTQKSKYATQYRRSEEGGMYGYSALQAGTKWRFAVAYKEERYIAKVEAKLLGEKRLGKSKTSQYGKVHIATVEAPQSIASFTPEDNLTYLYANARLVLFEEDGTLSATPTIDNLGLEGGEIVWEKTFIRTSTYTPYNYTRQTKEYTRVCINKGSVITIKNAKGDIGSKIGAFLSEGFGDVLVNPQFLQEKYPQLQEYNEKQVSTISSSGYDANLIDFLEAKEKREQETFAVASHVQKVYKQLIGPSKSQWGAIRALSTVAERKEQLIGSIEAYISTGVAQKQWEDKEAQLIQEIERSKNPLAFTKLLAMIVSRHTKGGKDGE